MIAFLRQNARWIAGGFLLTFFSSFGQTFFISASIAEWQAAFGLSHGEFGRLYMLATLASAASLPFLGRIVDVVPEHKVIGGVVPVLAGATLLAAFAPSVLALGVALYLLRLFGQGMMTHIALTATGRWFAASRGRAVSLVVLGHQGGEATLPLAFAALATLYGFRVGWIAGAVVLLLVALPLGMWAYARERVPTSPAEDQTMTVDVRDWTRNEVLVDPVFWILLTGVLAPPFIGTTLFFHQDYMTELRGWPVHLFATGLTLLAIVTTVTALVMGAVIDRFGARAVLPFFLYPLAGACLVAALIPSETGLYLTMLVLGISYGVSSTLFGALWPEVYGTVHLGAIRSVVVAAMVLATAAGPGLTGTLIDTGIDLPTQLIGLAAYCFAAALLMNFAAYRLRVRRS